MCNINTGLNIPINEYEQNSNIPTVKSQYKSNLLDFINNRQLQRDYNDEMVRQTWKYQKIYGFETNPKNGHEFWNVEADAFKHAFGSADMYFKYNNFWSTLGGINHEWQTNKNPRNEWNMDSWNNYQGRKIANEIKSAYGNSFNKFSQEQQYNIISDRIMQKMRQG